MATDDLQDFSAFARQDLDAESEQPDFSTFARRPDRDLPTPGLAESFARGLRAGAADVRSTFEAASSGKRPTGIYDNASPEAQPIEWSDLGDLPKLGAKLSYGMAKSAPTLATGAVGAAIGAEAGGPIGGVIGAGLGGAAGSFVQSLGPFVAEETARTPDDQDGAYDRALNRAYREGVFGGLSFAAFGIGPQKQFIKQIALQAFGVQPAIAIAHGATENVIAGEEPLKGADTTYLNAALGTAVPAAVIHGTVKGFSAVKSPRTPGEAPRASEGPEVIPPDEGAPGGFTRGRQAEPPPFSREAEDLDFSMFSRDREAPVADVRLLSGDGRRPGPTRERAGMAPDADIIIDVDAETGVAGVREAVSRGIERLPRQVRPTEVEPVQPQEVAAVVPPEVKPVGTRENPVKATDPTDMDLAAERVAKPTEAQKAAGNYRKGHVEVAGIPITIETARGQVRRGTAPDGSPWEVAMPAHYGYVKGTRAADGEKLDVYVGNNLNSNRAFVVDQVHADTGTFDEHKVILGTNSESEARALYMAGFSDGRGEQRIGRIREFSVDALKQKIAADEWRFDREFDVERPQLKKAPPAIDLDPAQKALGPKLRGRTPPAGANLLDFIAHMGVRPTSDLRAIGAMDQRGRGFRPGYGPMVRKSGRDIDMVREAAAEAGYLPLTSTVADFLDLIDSAMRGADVRPQGYEPTAADVSGRREHELEVERGKAEASVVAEVRAAGGDITDTDLIDRAVDLMQREGMEADEAIERAALALTAEELTPENQKAITDASNIPFFDEPALRDQAVSTGGTGGGSLVAEAAGAAEGPLGGGLEAVSDAGAPVREKTAAGEQGVIPGAERISDRELAERRASQPLRARADQKAADEGLFGDTAAQADLVEAARPPKVTEAKQDGGQFVAEADKGGVTDKGYGDTPEAAQIDALKKAGKWTEIGVNRHGDPLFEDSRGVRSYTRGGIRISEKVAIEPMRAGEAKRIDVGVRLAEPRGGLSDFLAVNNADSPTWAQILNALPKIAENGPKGRVKGRPDTDLLWPIMGEISGEQNGKFSDLTPEQKFRLLERLSEDFANVSNSLRETAPAVSGTAQSSDVRPAENGGDAGHALPDGGRGRAGDVRPDVGGDGLAAAEASQRQGAPGGTGSDTAYGQRDRAARTDLQPAPSLEQVKADTDAHIQARRSKNYRITDADEIGIGGPKAKVRANIDAIRLLKTIEAENRLPTDEEKKTLVRYVGWGAFAQEVFSGNKEAWRLEHAQLRDMLTPEEYAAARVSTLNAHYTSKDVIDGMWAVVERLGFTGGRALEPSAGVGHFIGLEPGHLADRTQWSAVELDSLTGRIAKALYGAADVNVMGYEKFERSNNFYDLAISNVPFGAYQLRDPKRPSMLIHDYFFVKALDQVRPGGIVAFITSSGTLDKAGSQARVSIEKRADFLGAIRLPGGDKGAFSGNAGTEVTTDILFLQKRAPGQPEGPLHNQFLKVGEIDTQDGKAPLNEYFIARPEMMLGEMRLAGTMYREKSPVLIGDSTDLKAKIIAAGEKLPANVVTAPTGRETRPIEPAVQVAGRAKPGAFVEEKGAIYRNVGGVGEAVKLSKADVVKVKGLMKLRDAYNTLLSPNRTKKQANDARAALNAEYDAFVKKFGPISRVTKTVTNRIGSDGQPLTIRRMPNFAAFKADPDAYKVLALENYNEETDVATKTAIFTSDVLSDPREIKVSSPSDAIAVSLDRHGMLQPAAIAELLGKPSDGIMESLGDLAYRDPDGNAWKPREEYLSGDVLTKLEEARAAAQTDPSYARNVVALEAVQPAPLTRADITPQMGAPWVPADVYVEFLKEEVGASRVVLSRNPMSNGWLFGVDTMFGSAAQAKYGTAKVDVQSIASAALNNSRIRVEFKDSDGKSVFDEAATTEAQIKIEAMRRAFAGNEDMGVASWAFLDDDRATRLEEIYNRTFNRYVKRDYSGAHLSLPGLARVIAGPDGVPRPFDLRPHQKAAVWRVVQSGNTLLAHVVGAGKAQPLDAKVLTPTGWRRMGDMRVGDEVIAGDGTPTRVIGVFPQGEKEIFRVTFSDGATTECCDEHLWLTQTYQERGYAQRGVKLGKLWPSGAAKVRPLSEIRSTLAAPHLGAKNHSIPMVGTVQSDPRSVPVDPYVMGVLLAEGCFRGNGVMFSTGDHEVVTRVSAAVPADCEVRHRAAYDYAIVYTGKMAYAAGGGAVLSHPVKTALMQFGLWGKYSHEKRVPRLYLDNAPDVRLAILRGLMDGDGTVDQKGSASYCTTSPGLADDVAELVRSFGGTVGRSEKPIVGHKTATILSVCLPPSVNPFALPRKASKVRAKSKYAPIRYIVGVESVGRKLAQCIAVAHPSHLYVTDDFIVTHNTFTMIAAAMEEQRLGLIKRPMFVVPNHMLEQFSREFLQAYPGASILVADKESMSREKRAEFAGRIAAERWNGIIITHDAFGRMGMSEDFAHSFMQDEINRYADALAELAGKEDRRSPTVKQLERAKKGLEERLRARMNAERKDVAATFEELGVDRLYVDEAHCFPAGTLVATNRGAITIDRIVRERLPVSVLSFDHESGRTIWRPVRNYWQHERRRRPFAVIMTEHGVLRCTPNHQIFVEGRGYVRAETVTSGERLRTLRGSVLFQKQRSEEERQAPVLRELLRVAVAYGSARSYREIIRTDASSDAPEMGMRCAISRADDARVVSQNEGSESYEAGVSQGQGVEVIARQNLPEPRRQWSGDSPSIAPALDDWSADGVLHQRQGGSRSIPVFAEALSGGFGRPVSPPSNRGRREFASHQEMEVSRPEKDGDTELSRVVSVEIVEPGSSGGPGSGGQEDQYVYDLGIEGEHNYFADGVLVHNSFKNLAFPTKMTRVKGLGGGGSQRAYDLFMKIAFLEGRTPGRSAVFATGTPISNTLAEMYTMQRYLQLSTLKERGIDNFDAWAQTFGEVVTSMELAPNGRTFQETSFFSRFVNIPELVQIYSQVADTQTADMLKLPRPELIKQPSGKRGITIVESEPSAAESAYINSLVKRAEQVKGKRSEKGADNMLKIVSEGRKVATDFRLIAESAAPNPNGKIAKLVNKVVDIHRRTKDDSGTQLIFLDMGTPKAKGKTKAKPAVEEEGPTIGDDGEIIQADLDESELNASAFNLYEAIRGDLVKRGIPREEIAFIHEATDDGKKGVLFDKVRRGKVRVLIGSTPKMGMGTNVQRKLAALHHVDAPWKPAEVEQRDGRILRQGNENPEVEIVRYVTKRSFDAFMWQTLERKAKFIGQLAAGARGMRKVEDIDDPLPEAAQMKAAASGDPRIMQHAELSREVRQLEAQASSHSSTIYAAKRALQKAVSDLAGLKEFVTKRKADAGKVKDLSGDNFVMAVGGRDFTKRTEAGEAMKATLLKRGRSTYGSLFHPETVLGLGRISGFDVVGLTWIETYKNSENQVTREAVFKVAVKGSDTYESGSFGLVEDSDAVGLVRRVENLIDRLPHILRETEERLANVEKQIPKLQEQAKDAPFPRAADLDTKRLALRQLTKELTEKPKEPAKEADLSPAPEVATPEQEESFKRLGSTIPTAEADRGPVFYSAVVRTVEASKTAKAGGDQWLATIRNAPGVKRDEIAWMGLEQWLKGRTGVTKDEVLAFVRANQIEVREIVSGAINALNEQLVPQGVVDEALARYRDTNLAGPQTDEIVRAAARGDMHAFREMERDGILPFDMLSQFRQAAEGQDAFFDDARYSKYTLPGGTGYRELLLALPSTARDNVRPAPHISARYQQEWDRLSSEIRALDDDRAQGGVAWRGANAVQMWRRYDSLQSERTALHDRMVDETIAESGGRLGNKDFTDSHFSTPNVVAHVRFKERVDVNGRRTLFVEEIQSDWHQKGRKNGYKTPLTADEQAELARLTEEYNRENDALRVADDDLKRLASEIERASNRVFGGREKARLQAEFDAAFQRRDAANTRRNAVDRKRSPLRRDSAVPDAPFRTTWPELAMKRAIRWAAENGYDQVAWTTGDQQNARYSLASHIERLEYNRETGHLLAYERGRGGQSDVPRIDQEVQPEQLNDMVGQDIAARLISGDRSGDGYSSLAGQDLEIGGEGMRGFYDKMLPKVANDLGKKFGAKTSVSKIDFSGGQPAEYGSIEAWKAAHDPMDVHMLPITPEMRANVLKGQPLFVTDRPSLIARDPVVSTTPAEQLEIVRGVTEIVRRIAGRDIALKIEQTIPVEEAVVGAKTREDLDRAVAARGGRRPATAGGSFQFPMPGYKAVIAIAIADPKYHPLTSAGHEAWHRVEETALNAGEQDFVRSANSQARADAIAAEELNFRPEDARFQAIADYERRAIAFQRYRRMREEGLNDAEAARKLNLGTRLAAIWSRLVRLFDAIRNWLAGRGFRTIEDIFESARQGEYADRPGAAGLPLGEPATPTRFGSVFDSAPVRAEKKATKRYVGSVEDLLHALATNSDADKIVIRQKVEALPERIRNPEAQERFYDLIEEQILPEARRTVVLTPEERADYENFVQPMLDKQQELFNYVRQKGLGGVHSELEVGALSPGDPGYVHRRVKGMTPEMDRYSGVGHDEPVWGSTRGRTLSSKTPSQRPRTMFVIEDEDGHRRVAALRSDGLYVFDNGVERRLRSSDGLDPGSSFRANNRVWTIKQATTREIEAETGLRYYKNAVVNTADNLIRLAQAARAIDALEALKSSQEFQRLATFVGSTGNRSRVPAGWTTVEVPQMMGWYLDPRLANPINDYFAGGKIIGSPVGDVIRAVNRILMGSLFWQPITHMANVGSHWFVARGWDNFTPAGVRSLFRDGWRAIRSVVTQDRDYIDIMRRGGAMIEASVRNRDFYEMMLRKMGTEIVQNYARWESFARKLGFGRDGRVGIGGVIDMVRAIYSASSNVLWASNDIFIVQRVFELERQGMSRDEAIREAETHIPNYRIPATVAGSRMVSLLMQDRAVTAFGRYHYGMAKSTALLLADNFRGPAKNRFENIGRLVALAFLMMVAGPIMLDLWKKLSGDKNARLIPRGATTLPQGVIDVLHDTKDFEAVLEGLVTVNPVLKETLQQFFDKDFFTGREIGEGPPVQNLIERGRHAVENTLLVTKDLQDPLRATKRAFGISRDSDAAIKARARADASARNRARREGIQGLPFTAR